MKKLLQGVLIFSILAIVASSCQQGPRTDDGREVADFAVFDPENIREGVAGLIDQAPKAGDVFDFLNETGAAYIFDLAVPYDVAEMHESSSQISLVAGAYFADLAYARAYNRRDVAAQTSELFISMLSRLGVQSELENTFAIIQEIRETEDQDVRDALFSQAINTFHNEMAESDIADTYALIFIGANIEALYIYTQLSLFARDNQAMIDFFTDREDMLKTVHDIFELMANEGYMELHPRMSGYHESMREIVAYYQAQDRITINELEVIGGMVENLRNEMLEV